MKGPQIDTTARDGWGMLKSVLYALGGLASAAALHGFFHI